MLLKFVVETWYNMEARNKQLKRLIEQTIRNKEYDNSKIVKDKLIIKKKKIIIIIKI